MKKLLLISFLVAIGFAVIAQSSNQRLVVPKALQDFGVSTKSITDIQNVNRVGTKTVNRFTKSGASFDEEIIGETKYDLQSNSATQNRMYVFADGTMAGVWTQAFTEAGGWPDRGTGYNYFDGSSWGTLPTTRIETGYRTGWPSYSPLGDGEVVVSHISDSQNPLGGLVVSTRSNRGTGAWTQSVLEGPTGNEGLLWPRMVATGNTIHIMALTTPTGNGGTVYNGLDGAILYYRSQDGGATWDKEHIQPTGVTSAEYNGFSGDSYAWAEPMGDTLAFIFGDSWEGLNILKSFDGGDTWTKIVAWNNPFPKFNTTTPPFATDTFYCPDGAHSVALDSEGKAHVFFGVNRAVCHDDGAGGLGTFWFPYADGVGYWNENMPPWVADTNIPGWRDILHPDTLFNNDQLVGWFQDLNENDSLDLVAAVSADVLAVGWYGLSLSSMPNAMIDANDDIYMVFGSINELRYDSDPGKNYRHVFARRKAAGMEWEPIIHPTGGLIHNYSECVFPNIAANAPGDKVYVLYQRDDDPGMFIRPDDDHQAAASDNDMTVLAITKPEFVGVEEQVSNIANVTQNYPNPFSTTSQVNVNLKKASTLSLQVYDMTGRMIETMDKGTVGAGMHSFTIDGSQLNSGIYFYTIVSGKDHVTKKMIVQ